MSTVGYLVMVCPKCGEIVSPDDKVCKHCGHEFKKRIKSAGCPPY